MSPSNQLLYYLTFLASLGFWSLLSIGSLIGIVRRRRATLIIQMIAAVLCTMILSVDFLMWNPQFGLLRGGMGMTSFSPDFRIAYQYLSQGSRAVFFFAFGLAFLVERFSTTRATADRGFVPELTPPVRRY